MKNHLLASLTTLICLSFVIFAQKQEAELMLREEYKPTDCANLTHHLDFLAIDTKANPNQKGFVVLNIGPNQIENEYYRRTIKDYYKDLGFENYELIVGKSEKILRIQFWIGKNGAHPEVESATIDLSLRAGGNRLRFAKETLQLVKIDTRWTYLVTGCADCCLHYLQADLLSDFLKANPDMKAEIHVYSESKKTTMQIKSALTQEFLLQSKILQQRTSIILRGKPILPPEEREFRSDLETKYRRSLADVEVWLVPNKTKH